MYGKKRERAKGSERVIISVLWNRTPLRRLGQYCRHILLFRTSSPKPNPSLYCFFWSLFYVLEDTGRIYKSSLLYNLKVQKGCSFSQGVTSKYYRRMCWTRCSVCCPPVDGGGAVQLHVFFLGPPYHFPLEMGHKNGLIELQTTWTSQLFLRNCPFNLCISPLPV